MSSNFNPSPRSSHRNPSRPTTQHSNGLQLLDINQLPISYPSPTPSLKPRISSEHRDAHVDENYMEENDDDDDDQWEIEHGYVDVGAEEASYLGAPVRPRPMHRESQDVEFGNRLPPTRRMRGRGRGWEVNVRIPHMKGLARGKTAFLKTLRGGLRRAHTAGHVPSNGSPPFEFRDPQPAPQSIRQQYAELAPSDSSAPVAQEMRIENGLLAPPLATNGPSPVTSDARGSLTMPDADAARRHSRSQSASDHPHSQIHSPSAQVLRPPSHRSRSHSAGSHHSSGSAETQSETIFAPHSTQTHVGGDGTAETTVVQHFNDIGLIPIYPSPSKSSKSSKSKSTGRPRRLNTLSSVGEFRLPAPITIARSRSHHTRRSSKPKAPFLRALHAFHRLPWIANPEAPPGAFLPTDSPPRVAKDFIPERSARAKLRDKPPGSGVVYSKNWIKADADGEENQSWYRPNARQVQRIVRTQRQQQARALAAGIGSLNIANGGPMQQAYASYRAASGRPLGYMYATPSYSASSGASPYTTHQYSEHTRANGSAAYGGPGSIAAAASAYLTRSASASQATGTGSGYASSAPPPVPPKSQPSQSASVAYPHSQTQLQPQTQTQSQQQAAYPYSYSNVTAQAPAQPVQYYTYNFAYPQNQPYVRSRVPGSSPPLPPLPPASYSLSYAPASSSGPSSQSIPTIPTVSSSTATPAPSARRHASSYSHGRSTSGSSGSATSGYGTVQPQGPVRYADYVYSYI